METQSRLSRHNKFISAENITILSISSDDYFYVKNNPHLLSLDTDWIFYIYIYIYIYICNSVFGYGSNIIMVLSIDFQCCRDLIIHNI